MKMKICLPLLLLLFPCYISCQNPEWVVFNSTNSGLGDNDVRSLSIDNNGVKWIGTVNDAVFTFDGAAWNHFNSANSYVFDDYILCISTDVQNNKWIGTRSGGMSEYDNSQWFFWDETHSDIPDDKVYDVQFEGSIKWVATMHGLASFDGTTWTTWNTSNSQIPAEEVKAIAIDGSGNKWITTAGGGIAKFDGTTWTVFDPSNSPLTDYYCSSLFYDGTFLWIGTSGHGLVRFDGTNWTVFNTTNSGLPSDFVFNTKAEGSKRWFATGAGLALLEGTSWAVYNPSNSGLPGQIVKDIEIDASGNKWLATDQGLAEFRQGGVLSRDEIHNPSEQMNVEIIPNPCSDITRIQLNLMKNTPVKIDLLDGLGKVLNQGRGLSSTDGFYTWSVQTEHLPAGIYYVRISSGKSFMSKKIIKY